MNIVIFTNDSYFSYLLSSNFFEENHNVISCVVFSKKITGSIMELYRVFTKTNYKYFAYRTIVQLITYYNNIFNGRSISSIAKKFALESTVVTDVSGVRNIVSQLGAQSLGITINFDQILPGDIINTFEYGIINIHASKLPDFRGISPALWAFAEGATELWTTIYLISEGIDYGPILTQFKIQVEAHDTAFSIYERICKTGDIILTKLIRNIVVGETMTTIQLQEEAGKYYSWPDKTHMLLMKNSKRRYICIPDILRAIS